MARGLLAWAVSYGNNSNYTRVSGTSFSTPLTAGAAALLLQEYPSLTPLAAINAIHQSGDRASNPDTIYGWGLLNISGAAAIIAATGVDSGGGNHGLPGLSLGLGSNIPNPFRGATTISYSLNGVADNRTVRLRIFDVSGRLVATLHDGATSPGQHAATWDGTRSDGRAAGNGIYFYRLESGTKSVARRMILVR
jgi:subtilisin family serine protease